MLVELLDEDYSVNKRLVLNALEGVESVFNLQSPTPKNEFCRMFVREGVAEPLSTALLNIVKDTSGEAETAKRQILGLLLLFCQIGQGDARIRDAFGSRSFVICEWGCARYLVKLTQDYETLRPTTQPSSPFTSSSTLGVEVDKALVDQPAATRRVAERGRHQSPYRLASRQAGSTRDECQSLSHLYAIILCLYSICQENCSHLLQTLLNLCRLSRSRQEEAAQNGLLPLLQQVISINSPLKEFALPLLCDMANSGKSARRQLWKIDGVQRMYFNARIYVSTFLNSPRI